MKILSIGNSFSDNAQKYLYQVARANGEDRFKTYNLYIGGCSLYQHYVNMLADRRAYDLQVNGMSTGFPIAIKEALLSDRWDVVTIQQVSHQSFDYDTYQPYLSALAEYVRKCAPQAKLCVHQTWAYLEGSERLQKDMGFEAPTDMFAEVEKCYARAAEEIDADGIIPAGKAMLKLYEYGLKNIHSDSIHASAGVGCLAIALTWYEYLTGKDCSKTDTSKIYFDTEVTAEEFDYAVRAAKEAIGR